MHGVKTKVNLNLLLISHPGPCNGDFLRFYYFSPLGLKHGKYTDTISETVIEC